MVQVLPAAPTFGGELGRGFGEGLGVGLPALINRFFESKREASEKEGLKGTLEQLGLAPELSQLPSDLQKEFIKQKFQQEKLSDLMGILERMGGSQTELSEVMDQSIPGQLTDQQILATSLIDPNLGKILQSQKEAGFKETEAIAKREFERAKPILTRADEQAELIIPKENALNLMISSIEEGNLGFLSPDNLAEMTGIEAFRTPSGAQFISAGKEFFLGSLKRAGARPNQWIEQQIQKMLPKIGRSKEANLTVAEALKSEISIDKEYQNILNRLVNEDQRKYGYIKGDVGNRARRELQKFANQEQKQLEQTLRQIKGAEAGKVRMRDPSGALRSVPRKDAKAAQEAGYTLVR